MFLRKVFSEFFIAKCFKKSLLFKNRNKVENPYYSLGLLQKTMVISSAGHHDLSVVCKAQGY